MIRQDVWRKDCSDHQPLTMGLFYRSLIFWPWLTTKSHPKQKKTMGGLSWKNTTLRQVWSLAHIYNIYLPSVCFVSLQNKGVELKKCNLFFLFSFFFFDNGGWYQGFAPARFPGHHAKRGSRSGSCVPLLSCFSLFAFVL